MFLIYKIKDSLSFLDFFQKHLCWSCSLHCVFPIFFLSCKIPFSESTSSSEIYQLSYNLGIGLSLPSASLSLKHPRWKLRWHLVGLWPCPLLGCVARGLWVQGAACGPLLMAWNSWLYWLITLSRALWSPALTTGQQGDGWVSRQLKACVQWTCPGNSWWVEKIMNGDAKIREYFSSFLPSLKES